MSRRMSSTDGARRRKRPPSPTTSYTWTFSRRFFTQLGVLAQQRGVTRRELVRLAIQREIDDAVKDGEVLGPLFTGPIGEDLLDLHQPSRSRRV